MTTFYLLLWMALATLACAAPICDVNVPDDCQPKCLNYAVNNVTNCSTCECIEIEFFEGDIKVNKNTEKKLTALVNGGKTRAISTEFTRWTDYPNGDTYEIPYEFNSTLPEVAKTAIKSAFNEFAANICLRFIPRADHEYYMSFFPGQGCYTYVGRLDGESPISIGTGCETKGIVIHEIMHSLTFFHEQSRPDRDNYVQIHTENIDPVYIGQFQKYSTSQINSMGSPYDYSSVMHYGPTYFSTNGKSTITKANGDPLTEFQRVTFAQTDIDQVNLIYCNSGTTTAPSTTSATSTPSTPGATVAPSTTSEPSTTGTTSVLRTTSSPSNSRLNNANFFLLFLLVLSHRFLL